MPNNAPLQNTLHETDRPHDTARKPTERRHIRKGPRTEMESLRVLAHYQAMLIELLQEKAEHGNA
jgi:hypothetical protein